MSAVEVRQFSVIVEWDTEDTVTRPSDATYWANVGIGAVIAR